MVAQLGVVAGEAQNVVNAQHGSAQKVGLQGDAVAVTAGHLEDGGQPRVLQSHTGRQASHTHDGRLVIGDVDGGDGRQMLLGFRYQMAAVSTLGRAYFRGHNKLTVIE